MSTPAVPVTRGTPKPQKLTSQQLDRLRGALEQQRRFRLDQLAGLRAGDERYGEIAESLATAARAALRDARAALRRMADGSYGTCAECGGALPVERLEVLPQVSRCGGCLRSAQP